MVKIYGFVGALIEIALFFAGSTAIYKSAEAFEDIDYGTYFWMTFTVMTMIWEIAYIALHDKTIDIARDLVNTDKHAWFEKYPITMVLPWELSTIFYGEYAAHADREYMNKKDMWSRIIEGTHALFCGFFAMLSLIFKLTGLDKQWYGCMIGFAFAQLMNSVLYMGKYAGQTKNQYNVNYDSPDFPLGKFWYKRAFMWINLPWSLMPVYVILRQLI